MILENSEQNENSRNHTHNKFQTNGENVVFNQRGWGHWRIIFSSCPHISHFLLEFTLYETYICKWNKEEAINVLETWENF